MNTLRQRLFTNWHIMRILRFAIGLWMLIMGIQSRDWAMGLFSSFFLIMAVTDTGCCGSQGCGVPPARTKVSDKKVLDDIEYEEIK
jgi:hypothetical protein